MNYKIGIILLSCYFIAGCSDYASGHKDGYGSAEMKQWIVFGRSEYIEGFETGKADKFQQEWLAENLTETNQLRLHCPDVFLVDPIIFLPIEYKKVGLDTYKIDSH